MERHYRLFIHVQYCDIIRFTVLHNRHHKVSQSVPFFMHCKTVTILLMIKVRGYFVMSITKNHESHYVTVLDNPHSLVLGSLKKTKKKPLRDSASGKMFYD